MYKENQKNSIRNLDIENRLIAKSYALVGLGILISSLIYIISIISPYIRYILYKNIGIILLCDFAITLIIIPSIYRIRTISYSTILSLYVINTFIRGLFLAYILQSFTIRSVITIFLTTCSFFASAAIYGHYTNKNLIKYNNLIIPSLIAILIVEIINIFLGSNTLQFLISLIIIPIMILMIAINAQTMTIIFKDENIDEENREILSKLTILLALKLYAAFINIFINLLELLGEKKKE